MKVLVIDDNRPLTETLSMMLELLGHEPSVAYCGEDAIVAAQADVPDVILLDIGLPDMDGYEACRRLRSNPALETNLIVAQSGRNDVDDINKAKAAGFDDFIAKPAPLEKLEHLLQKARCAGANQTLGR